MDNSSEQRDGRLGRRGFLGAAAIGAGALSIGGMTQPATAAPATKDHGGRFRYGADVAAAEAGRSSPASALA
ncbi:twin-arginine translocation signal domain-containing protein [Flexivirga aerilata]|uniref:twin-arginine translocation signal domain-containing protein n=1 Tax=Flexivirga aerilata TaxID=1656889 RepID=UPI001BB2BFB9